MNPIAAIFAFSSPFIIGIIIYLVYTSYREKQIVKYGKKYEATIAVVEPSFSSRTPDVYYEFFYNNKRKVLPCFRRFNDYYTYKGSTHIYYHPKYPNGVIVSDE